MWCRLGTDESRSQYVIIHRAVVSHVLAHKAKAIRRVRLNYEIICYVREVTVMPTYADGAQLTSAFVSLTQRYYVLGTSLMGLQRMMKFRLFLCHILIWPE